MSSDHSPRPWLSAVGLVCVVLVIAAFLGVLLGFATSNSLLFDSAWAAAALLSALVVVLTLGLLVLSGGPSDRWRRTPYW